MKLRYPFGSELWEYAPSPKNKSTNHYQFNSPWERKLHSLNEMQAAQAVSSVRCYIMEGSAQEANFLLCSCKTSHCWLEPNKQNLICPISCPRFWHESCSFPPLNSQVPKFAPTLNSSRFTEFYTNCLERTVRGFFFKGKREQQK